MWYNNYSKFRKELIKMVEIKVVSLEIPTVEALRARTEMAQTRDTIRRQEIEKQSWENFPNLIQAIFNIARKNADEGYHSCKVDIAASEEFKLIDHRIDYVFEGRIQCGMTSQIEEILIKAGYNVTKVHWYSGSSYRSMRIEFNWFED
jgi:hypothetical protein